MPLAIDLFCGLGGWSEALITDGWDVIGFDNERHEYDGEKYPGQLVLQDVLTLSGWQFKDADVIVASPPCTEYSYMAMPWSRAKQIRRALYGRDEFPEGYKGSRTIEELNALFDACFRIQREACEAAGRHIPLIVENVRGAQEWVGKARWNYGSFYLWGDVPALMPVAKRGAMKGCVGTVNGSGGFREQSSWDRETKAFSDEHVKLGGSWFGEYRKGQGPRNHGSNSKARKAASARIAKIPYPLAQHIARVFYPERQCKATSEAIE